MKCFGAPMGRWYKVNLFLRRGTIQSRMQLCLLYSDASVAGFLGVSTSLVKPYGERGGDSRPWVLSRKFSLYRRPLLRLFESSLCTNVIYSHDPKPHPQG